MADKQLSFEEEARVSLLSGVEQLRRVVGLTLGPSGRNVMLSRMFGNPVVCSDGVTIAKEVELPDPYENLGAQLVKEAASKTNDAVGDGTTTSVVLADAMVREGFKNVAAGANGMQLRTGIEAAVDAVVAELRTMAIPVEGREQIARVAALSATERRSPSNWPTRWKRSAGTEWSPSRSPSHWLTSWTSWKASASTGVTCRPTSLRTRSGWKWPSTTPTSCLRTRRSALPTT